MAKVLAVNIGTSNSRVAEIENGTIVNERCFPTPHAYDGALKQVWREAQALRARPSAPCGAVGICVADNLQDDGTLIGASNLPKWVGNNLRATMENISGLPVAVLNDCESEGVGAFAHYRRPLTFVGMGTGVGVSLVGADGSSIATEHGHDVLVVDSHRQCGCGGWGHAEAYLGGSCMSSWYRVEHPGHLTDWQVDKEVLPYLAAFLRNRSNGESKQSGFIVVGGGVGDKLIRPRLHELRRLVEQLNSTTPPPQIEIAPNIEQLGLLGAAFAAERLVV